MTFMERGYVEEFGYGAFRHQTKNEMLIVDTDVFGPGCLPGNADGRHFTLVTPDGDTHACYSVWDAMAAWLSHMLSCKIRADNENIQVATKKFLAKAPENEQIILDMAKFITTNYMNKKCAWGHKPIEDLIETNDAKLIIDLAGRLEDPYWGTIQGPDGSAVGRNMFGKILEQVRSSARPGYTTIAAACHGCTII